MERRRQTGKGPCHPGNNSAESVCFLLSLYIADLVLQKPVTYKCQWAQAIKALTKVCSCLVLKGS